MWGYLRQDWAKPRLSQQLLVQQVPTRGEARISGWLPKNSLIASRGRRVYDRTEKGRGWPKVTVDCWAGRLG